MALKLPTAETFGNLLPLHTHSLPRLSSNLTRLPLRCPLQCTMYPFTLEVNVYFSFMISLFRASHRDVRVLSISTLFLHHPYPCHVLYPPPFSAPYL